MSDSNIDVQKDAEKLNEIFESKNEDECIQFVAHRTNSVLQLIKEEYKTKYSKDVYKQIDDKFSGNFNKFLVVIFDTPEESDSKSLYFAMKGMGTNEGTLIEILASRTSEEIDKIKTKFVEKYNITLEDRIKDESLDKTFKNILFSLINDKRRINPIKPSVNTCKDIGTKLANKKKLEWENPDSDMYEMFIRTPSNELQLICQFFHKFKGKTIVEQIENDFSKYTKDLLIAILKANISPSEFFADKIYESVKGAGTNNYKLMRNVYYRCNRDIALVRKYYQKLYNIDMIKDIKDDTSGSFQKLLVELASKN